jgi:hypothetical protein
MKLVTDNKIVVVDRGLLALSVTPVSVWLASAFACLVQGHDFVSQDRGDTREIVEEAGLFPETRLRTATL